MTTEQQIEANKQNALLGGVKTEEGKRISRLNAMKHGFFSNLLIGEDKNLNKDFCDDIYDVFNPTDAYEGQLVEILISQLLAYRRISIVESKMFDQALKTSHFNLEPSNPMYFETISKNLADELLKFQRYKGTALNATIKLQLTLERLQRMRKGENLSPPHFSEVNISTDKLGSF